MLDYTEHEISSAHLLIKPKMLKNSFLAFKLSDVFIMLRNVKMPATVNIFEHDKFQCNLKLNSLIQYVVTRMTVCKGWSLSMHKDKRT